MWRWYCWLFLLNSCVTPDSKPDGIPQLQSLADGACHKQQVKDCDTFAADTMCFVDTYQDHFFPDAYAPRGWGRSECEARENLNQAMCRQGFQPIQEATIYCVPDPLMGACPAKLTNCKTEPPSPTVCMAGKYGGEILPKYRQLQGRGNSTCEARNDLMLAACSNLIDPKELEDVTCGVAKGSSCPPQRSWCRLDIGAVECQLKLASQESEPLSVVARSRCEAEIVLAQQLCSVNGEMDQSMLKQVECRSLK